MGDPDVQERHEPRVLVLKIALLALWAAASFGACFMARSLQFEVGPWPFDFWMAAQGSVLVFIAIVVFYAAVMNRLSPEDDAEAAAPRRDA